MNPVAKAAGFFYITPNLGEMPEWSIGPVSKTGVCHRTEGSNPSLS